MPAAIRLGPAALALVALVASAGGCGGDRSDRRHSAVAITLTRDFGAGLVDRARVPDPSRGPSAVDLLHLRFRVVTSRVRPVSVESIEGLASSPSLAWRLYVNGVQSPHATPLSRGDRAWWDLHDRAAGSGRTSVVGSFPEPFLSGLRGRRLPVVQACGEESRPACAEVRRRLGIVGVAVSRSAPGVAATPGIVRVLVGEWAQLRRDPVVALVDRGPGVSGVFARFDPTGRSLTLLDPRGRSRKVLGGGTGLVAAARGAGQAPTWLITGTDPAGVEAAARALDERTLANRFAVAVAASGPLALPMEPGPGL
jgi:hypothetical protein